VVKVSSLLRLPNRNSETFRQTIRISFLNPCYSRLIMHLPCRVASVLLTLSFMNAPAFGAAPDALAKLGSTVFHWDALAARPTPNGQRRDVADQPTATLERFESHITTLNPGSVSHVPHQHPQEELIILKEGTLDVTINDTLQRIGAGSVIFFASYDMHAVKNVGDTPATYVVLNFATAKTQQLTVESVSSLRLPRCLKSGVFDWSAIKVIPTPKGARRDFFDSPTITIANFESHATTIRAGEMPHPSHHHADEELVVVKSGTVEFTINGNAQTAGPGSIAFFASNDEHGLKNIGSEDATYYVIRVLTQ
jgi:quercetin dioxygenase-like cupin family protein